MKSTLKSLLQKTTLASTVSLLCATPFAAHAQEADNTLLTDRIIIKYKESAKVGRAAIMARETVEKVSHRAGHKMRHLRRMATGAQVMRLEGRKNKAELNAIVSRLKQDPDVEYAEPDLIMRAMATPNDPSYLNQWHYFESTGGLNLPNAWDVTQGEGAVVAVLDTGYRPHPDLIGNILPGYDMISDTFISVDGDGRDSDATDPGDWYENNACQIPDPRYWEADSSWHGTHVAGTIAAVGNNNMGVTGVAYKAKVVPVRVLGRCGGYTSDITDGIVWAAGGNVSGVPTNANPAQVLNMSLGSPSAASCSISYQNAISTARNLGATVVVAAGNAGAVANHPPGNCPGVINVAATNRSGGLSSYSNYGSAITVSAPGGQQSFLNDPNGILSTHNNGSRNPGSDSYFYNQGTSMAAPHVAGAAALLYSVDPNLTPDEVESILTSTARSACNGCGAGIVDAAAAVAVADGGDNGGGGGDGNGNGDGVSWTETNLSGSWRSRQDFTIEVAAGTSSLNVQMYGGEGDADLYVGHSNASQWECISRESSNNESCTISNPQTGTWDITVYGYRSYTGATLEAETVP
ncbi:S8 family peptidase [Microbulbifer epialgicus]|uniref:S8 family peptidase n=1 Tax=Microbulbifer epialgicus TaxID=393907 RepID=A0ABV4NWB2_9GAMM